MHSTAEVTALTIVPAAVLEAVALNAEAAVTSFARGAVQRAQMTAPDPAEVVVVAALASCGANRDERRNPNGDNASFCTECRCRNGRILSQELASAVHLLDCWEDISVETGEEPENYGEQRAILQAEYDAIKC